MRDLWRCLVVVAGPPMDIRISIVLRIMGGSFIRLILVRGLRLVIRIIIVFLLERGVVPKEGIRAKEMDES